MSSRTPRRAVLAAPFAALAVTGIAAAAGAAPLPRTGKVYAETGGFGTHNSLVLIVSASNPRSLVAGPAVTPLGSQYAVSIGALLCARATRSTTLAKGEKPFALFSFPGATLKLTDGHYGFSATKTDPRQQLLGSPVKPFTLKLTFTGTVTSATTITGTLAARGGPCTTARPVAWTAPLDPKEVAAPGA